MRTNKQKEKSKEKSFEWLKSLLWAIAIAVVVRLFLVGNFKIPSTSMVPTLKIGDRLLANKILYKIKEPSRGDVIIFKYPEDPKRDFVKRLIGLPSEKILIDEGKIVVDGKIIENPHINCRYYFSDGIYGTREELQIPAGRYYALGDNSINSKDSRYWGFVPKKNLVGKALFIYWPPWRMGFIR